MQLCLKYTNPDGFNLKAVGCTATVCVLKAPRTAAAILFEAGKRFKDLSWCVVGPEFLQQPFEFLLHQVHSIIVVDCFLHTVVCLCH